ncbi:GNAT family N-acetyltransferase [Undibacterium rugosum]|uniref:GNAT family N-acetyltransferase n=1 Tax=Undibacterium rugosum TaxID=2762291 RepID=UPI001B821BFF|nr:GNAT family N-acetyltransferase [Undibacterium rugosum]MBR7780407.1 GNAT family N-acetyltransferase [Undibacterium rugosum]
MSDQLVIRCVSKDDFPEWLTLWEGYNKFYGRHGETALDPEITRSTWARFFDEHEPMQAMVAERSGKLLGLVHFIYHRSTIQIKPVCYLQDLFTVDHARGMGVGRALINAVYNTAKAVGIQRVYWQTQETNTIAMQLYDQMAQKIPFVVYHKKL